jgi:hypothetical protein
MTKYKALFIHIPKTGGSSICTAPFLLIQGSINTDPAIPIKDHGLKLGFSFVRDPYTRFTSAALNHGFATPETFEKFVTTEFLERYEEEFEKWNNSDWGVFQPQYKFVCGGKNEILEWKAITFIGRFEKLERHWGFVCDMLDEKHKLPHINKNKYPNHADCHTEKTRKIVAEVYKKDFEAFGYKI